MVQSTIFRINEPSVIHQVFDDEVVVVHLATGAYHSLRGSATQVLLRLASNHSSSSEIVSHLAGRYDADPLVIEKDLTAFLRSLAHAAIIVPASRDTASTSEASPRNGTHVRSPYVPPVMESFDDLQQLVLLDPVHDVSAAGWPRPAEPVMDAVGSEFPLLRCGLAGPSVIFERFDTETVAMNLGTGSFHSLTGTAEAIFLLMPHRPSTWEIRDAVAAHYGIDRAELESALQPFLNALVAAGLIAHEAVAPASPQRSLVLEPTDPAAPYTPPLIESFQQPSMDAPPLHTEVKDIAFDPLLRLHYALRTTDLLYSSASPEIVVADRLQGFYFKLNRPASDIFRMLAGGTSVDMILDSLKASYAAPARSMRVSVMILLAKFKALDLIVQAGPLESRPPAMASSAQNPVPFNGFEAVLYHDLAETLRPFNPDAPEPPVLKLSGVRRAVQVLKDDFDEACGRGAIDESTYNIAGRIVRVRGVAGGHIADLTRALQHLRAAGNSPDLTIHIWSGNTASRDPLLDMSLSRLYDHWQQNCGPRGEMLNLHHLPVSAFYHPGPDTLSVVDLESGEAFYLCRNSAPLPSWEYGSPFRNILHPWFAAHGLQYTHAGAVSGPRGGVLLAGKGGSGKSTTAMLCAQAGMSYAADDYCLTDAKTLRAFSLYNTAKLSGVDDLTRVPAVRGHSFNSDGFEHGGAEKAAYTLSDIWPGRLIPALPLQAIVLPGVTWKKVSRLEPCSPADALLALTPSTVAQLHLAGNADCDRLASLAAQLPAFRLHLGTDLDRIPELLRQFTG